MSTSLAGDQPSQFVATSVSESITASPSRRGLALSIVAGWLSLSAMRFAANIVGGGLGELGWSELAAIILSVCSIWMPVSAAILWLDRSDTLRRPRSLVLAHLGFVAGVVTIEPAWLNMVLRGFGLPTDEYLSLLISRLDINALIYGVAVAADIASLRLQVLKLREVAAARLEQTLVDIQLHGLALQLQPHFLFNALQFVAETAHDDLEAARRTLRSLRSLLEQAYALESRVEVTVAEEMSFLRAYGEIQRSRFGDRFSLSLNVDETAMSGGIPPLLLQPLVENASRHGFARRGSGGHIEVIALRTRSDMLSIVVADDGVGLSGQLREGQGLSVTRRRLARLYGNDAHLTLTRAGDGRTEARVRIPFRPPQIQERANITEPAAPVPSSEFPVPSSRFIDRIPFAARVAGVWFALMGLMIGCTYAGVALHVFWPERLTDLKALFLDEMIGVPFWIALTIAAVFGAQRLSGRWAVPVHALMAVTIAGAHTILARTIALRVFGVQPTPDNNPAHWATWDVLVYAALVLIARSHELGDWVRTKMREEVTLNEEVMNATSRLARFREMQSLLLTSMDEVIGSPSMETLDRSVVDFADFLRFDVMGGVE